MPVTLTSEAMGQDVGAVYTGPEEAWLLANGYASQDGYVGPGVAGTGPSDVGVADEAIQDPENREEPGQDYAYGTGAELAPLVFDVAPASGAAAGGDTVTITGDNLIDVTGVTFGGVAGTGLNVVSDNEVEVIAPAHAAGAVDVVVTDPTGSDTAVGGYTYE